MFHVTGDLQSIHVTISRLDFGTDQHAALRTTEEDMRLNRSAAHRTTHHGCELDVRSALQTPAFPIERLSHTVPGCILPAILGKSNRSTTLRRLLSNVPSTSQLLFCFCSPSQEQRACPDQTPTTSRCHKMTSRCTPFTHVQHEHAEIALRLRSLVARTPLAAQATGTRSTVKPAH